MTGLLLLYDFLLIVAVILAIAERVVPRLGGAVPDLIRPVWPHRQLILTILSGLLLVLLVLVLLLGFGLESAVARAADDEVPMPLGPDGGSPTTPQVLERNLKRDVVIGSYALDRTFALTLVVLANAAALFGAGLTLWLDRHPGRPEPRLECYC